MATLVSPPVARAQERSPEFEHVAAWLLELQLTDPALPSFGAIREHHTPAHYGPDGEAWFRIVPYRASLAVLGLLRAGVPGAADVAEAWIAWYLAHLDLDSTPRGVVYDHWVRADGSGETSCPPGLPAALCDFDDASDSAAAMLLAVAWAYAQAGADTGFLSAPSVARDLEVVADVVTGLQDADGLTIAKASYPVKYLMDNCEAYLGLASMAALERHVIGDRRAEEIYRGAAKRVRKAIRDSLVDPVTSLYRIAKLEDGHYWSADLDSWYPDSAALLWPHLFGVTDPDTEQTRLQLGTVDAHWDWSRASIDPQGFPWTSIGYASLLAGKPDAARAQAERVLAEKLPPAPGDAGFAWPFAADDAGWLLSTLAALD